jgi:hypothetical protein
MDFMKRLTLATTVALLALPASALAASSSGVVLSVDQKHHTIQVVDSRHVVHLYHYRGRLPKLHAGSRIGFKSAGQTISRVGSASGKSHSVAFFGRVVSSSRHGLVLRLADGNTVSFSSRQVTHKRLPASKRHKHLAHAATDLSLTSGGVTINLQGLQPGVTVLVTETIDPAGNVTITITLPPASTPGVTGAQQASGVLTEVDTDAFVVQTADGSDLRLHMAQHTLSNLNLSPCDTVDVTYHQDAGMLIADNVQSTGTSTTGDCAVDPTPQDAVGTITQVASDSVTISTSDHGPLTFKVDDPSITDGFAVGDVVDVTYLQQSDGTLDASDVQLVEHDATGTVASVSDGSVTINVGSHQYTFTADPSQGMFDGVALGDSIDVTFHQSAGQFVADSVSDQSDEHSGD